MRLHSCYQKNPSFNLTARDYGSLLLNTARSYENCSLKLAKTSGKLHFLLKCRAFGLIPRSLLPSSAIEDNNHTRNILHNAGYSLLRHQIRTDRRTVALLLAEIREHMRDLAASIPNTLLAPVVAHVANESALLRSLHDGLLATKFEKLICSTTWEFRRSRSRSNLSLTAHLDRTVINLSSRTLNNMEKLVLAKGLNYVPTPKHVPILNIFSSVEAALDKVDKCKANEIRCAISNVLLSRACQPKLNQLRSNFGTTVV
ncbi:hypothetical protein M513_13717 [Trichuris suis]|uniref:Uncharacterized protein n=1 Tax=Trichuris suis TaxID=68888 RepID=A0A085LKA8_9BILA|nr:hypothetical protein M513_13717 [Trichuris suis]